MAITRNDPPIFVLRPNPFSPRAKIVGNMRDMKKLVKNTAQNPTWDQNPQGHEHNVGDAVRAHELVGCDEAHQIRRSESANSEGGKRATQEVSRNLLRLIRILLDIL